MCGLGVAMLLLTFLYNPEFDRSDPNYPRYQEAFDVLSSKLDSETANLSIDLSHLNNGEWKVACVLGGYTSPVEQMQTLGANINERDRDRMTEARTRGFRLAEVEEFEIAIAFVDLDNNARFIHFERGIGADGQHLKRCISKPETKLFLAPL